MSLFTNVGVVLLWPTIKMLFPACLDRIESLVISAGSYKVTVRFFLAAVGLAVSRVRVVSVLYMASKSTLLNT